MEGDEEVKENVKQQHHYTQHKIQPIEFIAANNLSFLAGNVIKYLCRYKEKDGMRDLEKARVYLEWLIEVEESGEVNP